MPKQMSMEEAIKLAEKVLASKKRRREVYENRKLHTLSGAELWNEFSNSNLKLND